jgi:hypothetical protein
MRRSTNQPESVAGPRVSRAAINAPWWTLSDDDLAEAIRDRNPPITAVLDTNVMLEVYTCHDVIDAYGKSIDKFKASPDLHTSLGDLDIVFDTKVQSRLTRARESLLLALHLHRARATTVILRDEFDEKLHELVPITPSGSLAQSFTSTVEHLVHKAMLCDWRVVADASPGTQRSHEADRDLLRFARAAGVPLISNEGRRPDGTIDWDGRKIPARAKAAGVIACSPREFCGALDEATERDEFRVRFNSGQERESWRTAIRRARCVYDLILLGPGAPDA